MRRINLVRFRPKDNVPIWDQLLLEEGLYRSTKGIEMGTGWLFMNQTSNVAQKPSVVLGFSGKIDKLVDEQERARQKVEMIRRFTGGGTVVVDEQTLFVSWLLDTDLVVGVKPYPRDIMNWSGEFYKNVFKRLGVENFQLRADDYVVDNVKIGGNAQAIGGKRWVHHTSFLWDFDSTLMKVLKQPEKQPEYRKNRDHDSFLKRICECVPNGTAVDFMDAVEAQMRTDFADVEIVEVPVSTVKEILDMNPERRKVTRRED